MQILLLVQHVSGHHYAHHQELKSIIRWLLPVVFRAVVFKLLVWCGSESYVSGLQDVVLAGTFKIEWLKNVPFGLKSDTVHFTHIVNLCDIYMTVKINSCYVLKLH